MSGPDSIMPDIVVGPLLAHSPQLDELVPGRKKKRGETSVVFLSISQH